MNKVNIFKKLSLGLVAIAAGLVIMASPVGAIPYNGDQTVSSPVPAFNVYTGNIPAPAPAGGEQNFFRGREVAGGNLNDPTTPYVDPVNSDCAAGKIIQMHVYVHNGASVNGNNGGSGPSVAHNTRVKVALPGNQGSNFSSNATISADNAASATDGLTINCGGQNVKLEYIAGSASQFSNKTGVLPLSDSIVSSGAPIQSSTVPGDVWGCWEDRVYVVLAVRVVVPENPVPVYTCDLLNIEANLNRSVKISTFNTTANNGATFKDAVVNWGDGTSTTDANIVGKTHTYAKDGTYTITSTARFTVNGQEVTATSQNCAKQVTFSSGKPPVVTPPTNVPGAGGPTTLVNTGPGQVAALFGATTAAGATAYRWMLGRRLG